MGRDNRIQRSGENAMPVTIRQLHPHFFGEVSGVDLRKPLTSQEASDIESGMDKYAVLLFRNQDITDEQQMAFALNFGERENPRGGNVTKQEDYRLRAERCVQSRKGRQAAAERSSRPSVQSWQLPLAFR
jgi:Taurine catabolism dioxygenase TauD, TfdA family